MDQGVVSVPVWVIASIVVPVVVGALEIMRRLGLRELSRWEDRVSDLEAQIDDLEHKMQGDHDGVAGEVGDLKDEIHALRNDMKR